MRQGKGSGRKDRTSQTEMRDTSGQSQECFLLERMSVRVNAGKGRGGGWKVVGPGLAGGRSPWHSVTQQGELPGGPTASFHSKGSHLFDQTYNFCASCSKQSGIST